VTQDNDHASREERGESKTGGLKLPYYPGCTLKTTARNLEDSALAVADALGIELVELPRWNCCGVVASLTDDDLMRHMGPVRNFIRVQEMNSTGLVEDELRLVALCSMCFNTLKQTNKRMHERPKDLKSINDLMYREEDYRGEVEVVHFLEILREIEPERIAGLVSDPLEGLKVAPYYGCTLLRPKGIGIDDPERPTAQDDLIRLLGATVVDNPRKTVCCGSYQTDDNKDAVANLAYDILTHARAAGADVVTTFCPLCAFNLDNRQRVVMERHPDFEPMPVLYLTQLMALAFGFGEEACRFDLNYTDPREVLEASRLVREGS